MHPLRNTFTRMQGRYSNISKWLRRVSWYLMHIILAWFSSYISKSSMSNVFAKDCYGHACDVIYLIHPIVLLEALSRRENHVIAYGRNANCVIALSKTEAVSWAQRNNRSKFIGRERDLPGHRTNSLITLKTWKSVKHPGLFWHRCDILMN